MPEKPELADPPRTLVEGERLDQRSFHALYQAMPLGTRAELIDGVVYMPSPVGPAHGLAQVAVVIWLAYYAEKTRGVQALDNVTTILGWRNEPQPDGLLRILPECGGRTWIRDGFLHGPPELVVEVAKASRYVDLGPKLVQYQQAGVLEYIVRALDPNELFWFTLEQGSLIQRQFGGDGPVRSTVFPGLWLDPRALLDGDYQRLREVVDLGCATPEHAEFVRRLAEPVIGA